MCSFAVSSSQRMSCCGHSPINSSMLDGSIIISDPSILAVPVVGEMFPVKMFISVVFPAPLCPSKVNSSPLGTSKNV